jgi:hypothetical protein
MHVVWLRVAAAGVRVCVRLIGPPRRCRRPRLLSTPVCWGRRYGGRGGRELVVVVVVVVVMVVV